jgi:arylsulfatase A-like enzyme/thioredoxin-like negative regulator of GroEL
VRPHRPAARGALPALPLLLAALALLAAGACRGRGGAAATGSYPRAPIVLISIDTLRSDHLPAYGYGGVATPAIDALAREGILYERAYSHIPLTLPSHLSILSGLLPGEHGVRDNVGYRFHADRVPYLPRLLKQAGYRTGGAVSAYVLRPETGISEGFDFYEGKIELRMSETIGRSQRSGAETLAAVEPWLAQAAAGPFFLFFHLYEPHTPYEPPEPYASRYRNPYDGEIATADQVVGDLVAELKRLGIYDRSIVVLLSDHGEGLMDHGEQEHGILLYREALQVPLVLKLPGGALAGTRVAAPAGLVDVAPTLLSLVRLAPQPAQHGGSLLALAREPGAAAPRDIYAETYYPRLHLGWNELSSLVRDRFHLIEGPDPELYDVAADPGERKNLRADERRAFAALRAAAKPHETPLAAPAQADEETARKLASLGYLGTASAPASGPLPDPKAHVHTVQDFADALRLVSRQDYPHAVAAFERLVAENPRMVDAWENLGEALQRMGRYEEAYAALQKAMAASGGVGHVALAMASVLLDMGKLDEAQTNAELGVETGPATAHSLLAQIALGRHDTAKAEREAQAALAARGSRLGPLMTLAQVRREQGRLADALAVTRQAEQELGQMKENRKFAGLFYVQGDILARLGQNPEAEAAFQREIADYPGDAKAYSRLAVLYAAENRPQEAVETLKKMVDTNAQSPGAYAEAVRALRVMGDPQSAAALLRDAMRRFPRDATLRSLAT